MAGAGFKTFNTGDVLTASDVNTYLMQQTVMVFDDASARTTAIPSPSEGMFSYLKDTNKTYRYDGSAWLDDAGTTSPLTTKGDLWTYSTTDARLAVGTDGQYLQADSSTSTGLKWAAGGALGWTEVSTGSLTGASVTVTSLNAKEFILLIDGASHDSGTNQYLAFQFNSDTGSNYYKLNSSPEERMRISATMSASTIVTNAFWITMAGNSEEITAVTPIGSPASVAGMGGVWKGSAAITSITMFPSNGNFDAGTYYIYARG